MSNIKVWDFWADKYERLWVQKYSLTPTRRAIIKEIKSILNIDKSYNILDMGCGIGQLITDMKSEFKDYNIKYTGVDLSGEMIKLAKSKDSETTYIVSSIDDFFAEEKFDIIICTHSFPYYQDKIASLKKFHTMLKSSGTLLLAQASANTVYDHIAMFFVKFTTGSAIYPSIKDIRKITKDILILLKIHKIKEKWYMPTICLFLLNKEE